MSTIYDFVTVFLFVLLIILFLHFSKDQDQKLGPYLGAAIACAVANFLGNEGSEVFASFIIFGIIGYIYFYIIQAGGIADHSDEF